MGSSESKQIYQQSSNKVALGTKQLINRISENDINTVANSIGYINKYMSQLDKRKKYIEPSLVKELSLINTNMGKLLNTNQNTKFKQEILRRIKEQEIRRNQLITNDKMPVQIRSKLSDMGNNIKTNYILNDVGLTKSVKDLKSGLKLLMDVNNLAEYKLKDEYNKQLTKRKEILVKEIQEFNKVLTPAFFNLKISDNVWKLTSLQMLDALRKRLDQNKKIYNEKNVSQLRQLRQECQRLKTKLKTLDSTNSLLYFGSSNPDLNFYKSLRDNLKSQILKKQSS